MSTYCVASSRYKRNGTNVELACSMIKMEAVSEEEAIGIYLREVKKDHPDWEITIPNGCILFVEEGSKKPVLREMANKYRDEKTPSLIEWSGISEFVFWAETEGC